MDKLKQSSIIERIAEFNKFGSHLGLERMEALLKILGNPHRELKVIHIAGTNGKGSVSRFIYHSFLKEYSPGLFTSPFLEVFNERIEMNGSLISDEDLEFFGDRVIKAARKMVEKGFDSPTEFELVTAIALLYFKEKKAEPVILEVGLGGRGDSTNVIDEPLVSIITSIGFDHMDRLGETLEDIAFEKAGIIKRGVPVLASAKNLGAKEVIKNIARERKSEFIEPSNFRIVESDFKGSTFERSGIAHRISMLGKYQIENANLALDALEILRKDYNISDIAIRQGFFEARNKARFEIIEENPLLVLEGAHNIDGIRAFISTLKDMYKEDKITLVMGVLKDKDVASMVKELSELRNIFKVEVLATEVDMDRSLDRDELREILLNESFEKVESLSLNDVIKRIKVRKNAVFCIGSLYLMGYLRGRLSNEYDK